MRLFYNRFTIKRTQNCRKRFQIPLDVFGLKSNFCNRVFGSSVYLSKSQHFKWNFLIIFQSYEKGAQFSGI